MKPILVTLLALTCLSCDKPQPPRSKKASSASLTTPDDISHWTVGLGVLRLRRPPLKKLPQHVVIRTQKEYQQLLRKVINYVPRPVPPNRPSSDPLLDKPPVDFSRKMIVVVRRYSAKCPPQVTRIRRIPGKKVIVEAIQPECFAHFSMTDKWSYQAVVTLRMKEPVELRLTQTKRPQ